MVLRAEVVPGGEGRARLLAGDQGKDPPEFMVLAEDSANLLGISVAAAGTFLASTLGVEAADGGASTLVGPILLVVGWVLVRESKGLLIGERGPPDRGRSGEGPVVVDQRALREPRRNGRRERGRRDPARAQSGARGGSFEFDDELRTPEIEKAVQEVEARIREKHPEVVALYVKPQSRRGVREAVKAHRRSVAFISPRGRERAGDGGEGEAAE